MIEIKNLSKNFGPKQAVSGLDMTVPMGAIYGFIGENGSGKSTTEKLICGHLVPDGGEIIALASSRCAFDSAFAAAKFALSTSCCAFALSFICLYYTAGLFEIFLRNV